MDIKQRQSNIELLRMAAMFAKTAVLHIVSSSLLIFITGAMIDIIRQFLERHTVNKILDGKSFLR